MLTLFPDSQHTNSPFSRIVFALVLHLRLEPIKSNCLGITGSDDCVTKGDEIFQKSNNCF